MRRTLGCPDAPLTPPDRRNGAHLARNWKFEALNVICLMGFYTSVSMTPLFTTCRPERPAWRAEHANSTGYSISRFYFLAMGIHQSSCVASPAGPASAVSG